MDNYKANYYSILSDSDLRRVCEIIASNLNNHLSLGNIDVDELDAKLSDLKIFNYSGFSYGFYTQDDGILGLNILSFSKLKYDYDVLTSVVRHESNHLVQANSVLEKEKEGYTIKYGPSYKWSDLTVNSLYWDWFFEGTAESLNIDNYSRESLTYKNEIKALDTLKVATILDSDNNYDTLDRISLQSDLNQIFDYFNSSDNKEEIVKMMYAFNLILRDEPQSSTNDFYKYYESFNDKKIDKLYFRQSLKGSVALTLSKIFYSNLFNEIENKEIKLDDVFKIIALFENEIS